MSEESMSKEVIQSIKAIFDLTARVDERVKMLAEKQINTEKKIEMIVVVQNDMATKLGILETRNGNHLKEDMNSLTDEVQELYDNVKNLDTRIANMEKAKNVNDNRWSLVFDFIYKTFWVIFVCYLLYKLNLQAPPLP